MKKHEYRIATRWTGNPGTGTSDYRTYRRDHTVSVEAKPDLLLSSDPAFRGDPTRHNPEELLVASLSSCHMLWFLHLCAVAGVVVVDYTDEATGSLREEKDGSGRFEEVILRPRVVVTHPDMVKRAQTTHAKAHKMCFIANSCNFPIYHDPVCVVQGEE
ncbi:Organic hydroperoxide reductase OsmC/OhrA [Catalinimonas alkaloidigena]|uniref:Organic hydroperoxide reductase OsmC/OhrA n=1 Tax=Catalinimonas alkaloidigena TaxID=1075417 RepID=A0A1G9HXH1_9BACT|nr:OsmC family protein [Catalinimonas alkaloidigena]SDL17717.1 Organic hydroperoxide reductase OsmC/OhrA [Catalinimonas alkaloidigena]